MAQRCGCDRFLALGHSRHVQALRISLDTPSATAFVSALKTTVHLTRLDLACANPEHISALQGLQQLTCLDLLHSRINAAALDTLCALASLTCVRINFMIIEGLTGDQVCETIATRLPALKEFAVSNILFMSNILFTHSGLTALSRMTSLTALDLSYCLVMKADGRTLADHVALLAGLPMLQELGMFEWRDPEVQPDEYRRAVALISPSMRKLHVRLWGTMLLSAIEAIAALSHLTNLDLEAADATTVSALAAGAAPLRQLTLWWKGVKDGCVPALLRMRRLVRVEVCCVQLSAEGVARLRTSGGLIVE